jgi:hypothetical protein
VETVLECVKRVTDETAPWAVVEVQDAALRQDPVAQLRLPRSSPAFLQVGDVPHPAFNSFRCRASAGGHWARVARLDDSTSFKVEKLMNSSSLKVTWIRDSINEFCRLSEAAFASGLVATGALASFSSLVSESAKAASSAYVRIRRILRASSRRTRRVPPRIQSQRRTRAPTEHRCRNGPDVAHQTVTDDALLGRTTSTYTHITARSLFSPPPPASASIGLLPSLSVPARTTLRVPRHEALHSASAETTRSVDKALSVATSCASVRLSCPRTPTRPGLP